MTPQPRIVLIHALALSPAPINAAFERLWPEAGRINLLDDSLSADRAADGCLTPAMIDRFLTLGRYVAHQCRADAILFTCSAFGPAIDAVAADLAIPVLKPNSAMIAHAEAMGGTIGLLATFEPAIASMTPEFSNRVHLRPMLAAGALAAAQAGDFATHDRLAAEAAQRIGPCDVIALGQFSLARAAPAVAEATGLPVLTTPDCAVEALRAQLG